MMAHEVLSVGTLLVAMLPAFGFSRSTLSANNFRVRTISKGRQRLGRKWAEFRSVGAGDNAISIWILLEYTFCEQLSGPSDSKGQQRLGVIRAEVSYERPYVHQLRKLHSGNMRSALYNNTIPNLQLIAAFTGEYVKVLKK